MDNSGWEESSSLIIILPGVKLNNSNLQFILFSLISLKNGWARA